MVTEIQAYAIGFVFGHVEVQIEYINYLIFGHGAKSNRTLPSSVISH